jgi:hypothetical protein
MYGIHIKSKIKRKADMTDGNEGKYGAGRKMRSPEPM